MLQVTCTSYEYSTIIKCVHNAAYSSRYCIQRDISTIKIRIHNKKAIVISQDSKQLIRN
jgi:hypothetical protein